MSLFESLLKAIYHDCSKMCIKCVSGMRILNEIIDDLFNLYFSLFN